MATETSIEFGGTKTKRHSDVSSSTKHQVKRSSDIDTLSQESHLETLAGRFGFMIRLLHMS